MESARKREFFFKKHLKYNKIYLMSVQENIVTKNNLNKNTT